MKTIALLGQSNFARWTTVVSNPGTPASGTTVWDGSQSAWVPPAGDAAIEFLNQVAANTGDSVRLFQAAVGGAALCAASANPPPSYWLNTAGGSPLANFLGMMAASGVVPDLLLWCQGENDGINGAEAAYSDGLAELYLRILRATGKSSANLPFIVGVTGKVTSGGSAGPIRKAQLDFAAQFPGARPGPSHIDLPLGSGADAMHILPGSIKTHARRWAKSALKEFGASAYSGAGPTLVSAARAGGTIRLTVQHNGGTGLWPLNPNTDLTGFEVSADNFATTLPIKCAHILNAAEIALVLTSPPSGPVKVRYQWGQTPDTSNAVFDNGNPLGDPYGLPLMPTAAWLTTPY